MAVGRHADHYDSLIAGTPLVAGSRPTSPKGPEFDRHQTAEHATGPTPDRIALIQALGHIPAKQRLVLVLHYLPQTVAGAYDSNAAPDEQTPSDNTLHTSLRLK